MLLRGLLLTVTLLLLALPSQAQTRRVALVVGNSAYQHAGALQNAVSDADAVANTLRRLGFTVTLERDQSAVAMRRTLRDFSDAARGADVALFFYAGHGLQMGQRDRAENFLVPIDARLTDARDLEDEAISLSRILQLMDGAKARIVILDACRDNPLLARMTQAGGTRGVSRGLAPIEASGAQGTLVAFSTAPGTVAADGTGRNSPFTTALLKHLPTPGLEIRSALTRVRAEVADATRNAQVPWSNDGLLHELFLAGEAAAPATTSQQAALAPPTLAPTEVAIELAFWQSIQNSRNSADFEDYLRRYPTGNFAGLARNRIAAMRETTEATAPALPSVPPPAHECDRLAQLPRSSMASVPAFAEGVEFSRIDVPLARRACQVARTAYPTEPRFMALAGRVEHAARNYAEALRLYRLAADQGYPIAQSNLGAMYANGQGVRRDDAEAVRLYRLAVDQGNAAAQTNLGWMYENGRGVPRDRSEAIRLYRLAAAQENQLAISHLRRLGVSR